MIRQLVEADRAALVALLGNEPETNLYFLGNIEAVGFAQPFCTLWGDFASDGTLRGVTNRYFVNWIVYGLPDADWPALAALIDGDAQAERLQDNPGGVPSILPFLHKHTVHRVEIETLMRLRFGALRAQQPPTGWQIRRATPNDVDALVALYADAGHMARTRAGIERPLRDARIFVAVGRDGDIPAAALTNAETHTPRPMAMIGGVYTRPNQRGLGLSQAVCSALCADLIADGLMPVLYWITPAAGRVYAKLGFEPIGAWRAVMLQPVARAV